LSLRPLGGRGGAGMLSLVFVESGSGVGEMPGEMLESECLDERDLLEEPVEVDDNAESRASRNVLSCEALAACLDAQLDTDIPFYELL
jgi:hypothetical protein